MLARFKGAIAQLGERYNGIVEVSGSIPLSSTKLPKRPANGGFFVSGYLSYNLSGHLSDLWPIVRERDVWGGQPVLCGGDICIGEANAF